MARKTKTRLFMLVATCGGTGSNLDLLVRAVDRAEAITGWRNYYELDETERPRMVFAVNETTIGPLRWHSTDGLELV